MKFERVQAGWYKCLVRGTHSRFEIVKYGDMWEIRFFKDTFARAEHRSHFYSLKEAKAYVEKEAKAM